MTEFERLAAELVDAARAASGMLWADVARAADDEPSFILLSEWRTHADLDAWESSDETVRVRDEIDNVARGDVTRRRFDGT